MQFCGNYLTCRQRGSRMRIGLTLALALIPTAALAHAGHGEGVVHDFLYSFGIDHMLATVAVMALAGIAMTRLTQAPARRDGLSVPPRPCTGGGTRCRRRRPACRRRPCARRAAATTPPS